MSRRFALDLAVPRTDNQGAYDIRPVTVQRRTSVGCRRTSRPMATAES